MELAFAQVIKWKKQMMRKSRIRNRRNGGRSAPVSLQIRFTQGIMMRFIAGIVTLGLSQFAVQLNVITVKVDHRTTFTLQKRIGN